ncbi:MAG TPA: helix-turn-helix transcriptional regulator [Streptosporangiaceae bacterium]|nr:helix-turn-helix transcriptional regulator [Streptosporangiaceae bacterium]
MLRECVKLARSLGDDGAEAYATQLIGTATWMQNQLPEAVPYLERALRRHQAAGELNSVTAIVSCQLGMVVALLGDVPRGTALCEECVSICDANGESWTHSWAQWNHAVTRWSLGETERASEHAKRSLRLKRAIRDQLGIPFCVEFLAWIALAGSDAERAATLFGVSDKMWEPISAPLFGWGTLRGWSDHCRHHARLALTDRTFEAAYERGKRLAFDAAVAYALGDAADAPAAAEPAADSAGPRLTRREREVAALVADGRSNKEIATSLVISQRTAENHVEHILVKLDFTRRTQIATWIAEHQPQGRG